MFRLLKALPLTLALTALTFFATSCGSSNQAQIRVINAIPDVPNNTPLDIVVNGTKIVTALAFGGISPSTTPPATYTKVKAGSDTITAFVNGTTTNPVNNGTTSLSGSSQYTVVLNGRAANNNPPGVLTDNNAAPTSGNLEFRVIDASVFTPADGFDVYITPPSGDITGITPQTIVIGQATSYVSVANGSYNVVVIPHSGSIPSINQNYAELDGSIRTVVIVDNPGGGSGPATPLLFTDLN